LENDKKEEFLMYVRIELKRELWGRILSANRKNTHYEKIQDIDFVGLYIL